MTTITDGAPAPISTYDYTDGSGGDGYDWMDAARSDGWVALSCWGLDGWDLGQWPYVIVALRHRPASTGPWQVAVNVEHDVNVRTYSTRADAVAAIDDTAAFYWRVLKTGPASFTPDGPIADRHRGQFSWARLTADDACRGIAAAWWRMPFPKEIDR